jgi:hypothetical protein
MRKGTEGERKSLEKQVVRKGLLDKGKKGWNSEGNKGSGWMRTKEIRRSSLTSWENQNVSLDTFFKEEEVKASKIERI